MLTSRKVQGKSDPEGDVAEPVKDEHDDPPAKEAEIYPRLPKQDPPANG
jgi:hypothetical protein